MTEKLGFDQTLTMALLGAIALFAIGSIVSNIGEYDDTTAKNKQNLDATAGLLQDLSIIAAGAIFILAAIRAEGHSTGLRMGLAIVGLLLIFNNVFNFGVGFNLGGGN